MNFNNNEQIFKKIHEEASKETYKNSIYPQNSADLYSNQDSDKKKFLENNAKNLSALEFKDYNKKYLENVINYKNNLYNQVNNHQITQQVFPLTIYDSLIGKNRNMTSQIDYSKRTITNEDSDICAPSNELLAESQGKKLYEENSDMKLIQSLHLNLNKQNYYLNYNPNQNQNCHLNFAFYDKKQSQNKFHKQHSDFPVKNKQNTYNYNVTNYVTINFPFLDDQTLAQGAIFLARDQTGCRLLQNKIISNPKWGTNEVFPLVFPHLIDLIIDPFGNYFIQNLIEYLNYQDLAKIIQFINPNFYEIGINIHGTRVIQKFIEKIKNPLLYDLFKLGFQPNLVDLMKDVNGNHIVIKFAQTLKYQDRQFLYEVIEENLIDLVTNKHSCCAFQKCVETATDEQKEILIEKIVDNTFIFMSDQYGNYVLQFVISLNNHKVNEKISTFFKNKIAYFARQKFSSNVIEKLFNYCNEKTKFNMIKEICNPKTILDLLLDMYGNYGKIKFILYICLVLQKVLIYAVEPYKSFFFNSIAPHLEKLRNLPFGQILYGKMLSFFPEIKFVKIENSCGVRLGIQNFQNFQNFQLTRKNPQTQIYCDLNNNYKNVNRLNIQSGNVKYFNADFQNINQYQNNYTIYNNNIENANFNYFNNQLNPNNLKTI